MPDRSSSSTDQGFEIGGTRLSPGDKLGDYTYDRRIGSGGMARVLKAKDPEGHTVALKVLRRNRFKTGLERFRREFHALSRLNHPNIVRVFSYGDVFGHPYIAMEYVDGPDLHALIRRFKHWDDARRYKRCEEVLVDLCRALGAIHRRGLVHRDLKPSNVLMSNEGVCKLTDFGIVKDLDPSADPHLSTTLVGTWAYTSPEHICGRPVDHRSDLYSLGVILFVMLTGRRPFVAENMAGYLTLHRDKAPPAPAEVRPGVPPHLAEIATRLLEKEPKHRFQSAQEILYRLEVDEAVGSPTPQRGWVPPLTGADAPVEALSNAVAALTDGRGSAVRVLGEDGSGKTRLLDVAVEHARMLGFPFHQVDMHAEESVFAATVQLARDLIRELPDGTGSDLEGVLRDYAKGAELRGDSRYALYDGVRAAFEGVLKDQPRVVLIDDLDQAHAAEVQLVRYLVRNLILGAELPLLVIFTERPRALDAPQETHIDVGMPTTDVVVSPLDRPDIERIVESLVGRGRAAALLAARLHKESEGNPYFATEFLRSMVVQGLIRPIDGGHELTLAPEEIAEGHLEIPPGIRQMVRRRIADVSGEDREILEVLSASAHPTSLDVILELIDHDEDDALDALARLSDLGIVRERRHDEFLVYSVRHHKLGDVLHQDLSPGRRQALHRQLALALEKHSISDAESHQVIGEHYRRAGMSGEAFRHLVMGAKYLVDRSLLGEAGDVTTRADAVKAEAEKSLSAHDFRALRYTHLMSTGTIRYHAGEWIPATNAFNKAVQVSERMDSDERTCDARIQLATALRRRGRLDESYGQADEALGLAKAAGYAKGIAEALHCASALAWSKGDLDRCERLSREGLQVARGPRLAEQRARLLLSMTTVQAIRSQLVDAVAGLEEAEQIFRELRMKRPRVLALTNIAELLTWRGHPEQARKKAELACTLAEELDYALGRAASLRSRGVALLELGKYGAAHDDLHAAVRIAERISLSEEILASRVALTRLSIDRGDHDGALRHGAEGLKVAKKHDPEHYLPLLEALLARAMARTRPTSAESLLRSVDQQVGALHAPRQAQVHLATAWSHLALDQRGSAQDHAQSAVALCQQHGFRLAEVEARAILALVSPAEERDRHRQRGHDLVRTFTDELPRQSVDSLQGRPFLRHLADA